MPQGERERKVKHFSLGPPQGVQGVPPDTPLVTFVVKRKSPGVEGRSAPSWGVQRGSAPRISGHAGAPVPAKTSEGEAIPLYLYPETNKKLHPNVQPSNKKISPPRGKILRCAVAGARIGRAIMAQQKKRGNFPSLFCCIFKV